MSKNAKDPDIEIITGGGPGSFSKSLARQHSFYLSGEVLEPEEYIEWFDTIRNCGSDDEVIIHINSMGGNVDTAIQFIRVLSETAATVTTSVEGSCMSAATMIFLSGHCFQITPFSLFMFHNYSGGTFGKGGEMYDNVVFERNWSTKFLHYIYKDFLTEAEIKQILDNKDIWMDHEEATIRCKRFAEARIARAKEKKVEDADASA
jgi:ATP-dependent protease ClpP protease subunit